MNKLIVSGLCALLPALSLSFSLPIVSPEAHAAQEPDLWTKATGTGKFTLFLRAIYTAGLENSLRNDGPYTLYAPTDAAFAKLPKDTLARLLNDRVVLRQVLLYHILPGQFNADETAKMNTHGTLEGHELNMRVRDGSIYINHARIIEADISAHNGHLHAIDHVLIPPRLFQPGVPNLRVPHESH